VLRQIFLGDLKRDFPVGVCFLAGVPQFLDSIGCIWAIPYTSYSNIMSAFNAKIILNTQVKEFAFLPNIYTLRIQFARYKIFNFHNIKTTLFISSKF
jgi:hypothetical protein